MVEIVELLSTLYQFQNKCTNQRYDGYLNIIKINTIQ